MPFYEYKCADPAHACDHCKDVFEIMQSILAEPIKVCPDCGYPVEKQISQIAGAVFKGREMNSYNDVKIAKYWRDKNGDLHKVGPGDGCLSSGGVGRKQTASPQQIEAKKKRDAEIRKRQRGVESYKRFLQNAKRARENKK